MKRFVPTNIIELSMPWPSCDMDDEDQIKEREVLLMTYNIHNHLQSALNKRKVGSQLSLNFKNTIVLNENEREIKSHINEL
jgi:hypothetical protein